MATYSDEEIIQAARRVRTKGAKQGLRVLTRKDAKFALSTSIPLDMLRAFAEQLPTKPAPTPEQ